MLSSEPRETVTDGHLFLEGPVWDVERGWLIFSDIPASRMFALSDEGVQVYREPSNMANGNTTDRVGRLITCEHATSRVVREERDGGMVVLASTYEGYELNSPNDVVVDRAGNVLFTDPTYGRMEFFGVPREPQLGSRGVYMVVGGKGPVVRLADDFDQPNGLCLSLDERRLFVNDSERRHIRVFEVRADGLGGGDVWADMPEGAEPPDGMKLDAQGNVYCTGPGGICVFSPTSEFLGTIPVPQPVGNFAWGGADLQTLYICASTALYRCRTRVQGWRNQ